MEATMQNSKCNIILARDYDKVLVWQYWES